MATVVQGLESNAKDLPAIARTVTIGVVLGSSMRKAASMAADILRSLKRSHRAKILQVRFHGGLDGQTEKNLLLAFSDAFSGLEFSSDPEEVQVTYAQADVVITGGGYSKMDAVGSSAIVGVLALRMHQLPLAHAFETSGYGVYLGRGFLAPQKSWRRLSGFVDWILVGGHLVAGAPVEECS